VRRAVAALRGEKLLGLVDAAERSHFETHLTDVFACDPDLESEFIRALSVAGVEAVLDGEGLRFHASWQTPKLAHVELGRRSCCASIADQTVESGRTTRTRSEGSSFSSPWPYILPSAASASELISISD
jgi:hypothetical protein